MSRCMHEESASSGRREASVRAASSLIFSAITNRLWDQHQSSPSPDTLDVLIPTVVWRILMHITEVVSAFWLAGLNSPFLHISLHHCYHKPYWTGSVFHVRFSFIIFSEEFSCYPFWCSRCLHERLVVIHFIEKRRCCSWRTCHFIGEAFFVFPFSRWFLLMAFHCNNLFSFSAV